jgi:hypothetical protein
LWKRVGRVSCKVKCKSLRRNSFLKRVHNTPSQEAATLTDCERTHHVHVYNRQQLRAKVNGLRACKIAQQQHQSLGRRPCIDFAFEFFKTFFLFCRRPSCSKRCAAGEAALAAKTRKRTSAFLVPRMACRRRPPLTSTTTW